MKLRLAMSIGMLLVLCCGVAPVDQLQDPTDRAMEHKPQHRSPPPNCEARVLGQPVACPTVELECPDGTVQQAINGCPSCVDPETCMPPSDRCLSDLDCRCDRERCDLCERGVCVVGSGARCDRTVSEHFCAADPWECPTGKLIAARYGCWECVDPRTCVP